MKISGNVLSPGTGRSTAVRRRTRPEVRPGVRPEVRPEVQPGWRVVHVGAGPGYATWDLAEIVGASGQVVAIERSQRFVDVLTTERARRGLPQVRVIASDVLDGPALSGFDMAWCRWVASFVLSVPGLVQWIHSALRPGGRAVFHEYLDYASWQVVPARPAIGGFVETVMASWRATGGEPDVAPRVIEALTTRGFRVTGVRPLVFAARPGEPMWRWPAAFMASHAGHMAQQGVVSAEWAQQVAQELAAAESDPASLMVTPMVLEVIAERSQVGGFQPAAPTS